MTSWRFLLRFGSESPKGLWEPNFSKQNFWISERRHQIKNLEKIKFDIKKKKKKKKKKKFFFFFLVSSHIIILKLALAVLPKNMENRSKNDVFFIFQLIFALSDVFSTYISHITYKKLISQKKKNYVDFLKKITPSPRFFEL